MKTNTIAVMVACHKPYPLPDEPCYLPVEVGAALHPQPIPGFTPDNTGGMLSVSVLIAENFVERYVVLANIRIES